EQRGRGAQSRAPRRAVFYQHVDAGGGAIETKDARAEIERPAKRKRFDGGGRLFRAGVDGTEGDGRVVAGRDPHPAAEIDADVDGDASLFEEIEGVDVERAAGEVDAAWGGGFN